MKEAKARKASGPDNSKRGEPQVLAAVVLLASDLEDDRVAAHLVQHGCTEAQAWKLVTLVPMAFARVVFEPAGVRFYQHYLRFNPVSSKRRRQPLAREPFYQGAFRYAQRLAAAQRVEALYEIVKRSADYAAIQELRRAGCPLQAIRLTEPEVAVSP
jgi:hypothetical protein